MYKRSRILNTTGWEKVIHKKLLKKIKFIHTTKWYMHKTESVLETGTHKILWNFKMQTGHWITPRKLNITLINKKKRLAISWILLFRQITEWK